jgi:hypothetical protein
VRSIYYTADVDKDGYAEENAVIKSFKVSGRLPLEKIKERVKEALEAMGVDSSGRIVKELPFRRGWRKFFDDRSLKKIRDEIPDRYNYGVSRYHIDVIRDDICWLVITVPVYGFF